MPNVEPTYLRYVYDGLNKGSLNAENAAALPQGFIGLYEQEFTQKIPAGERKKVLNQLALWALFKGPVSANMAAAVLELEEEQMKDLVDTYSSWFNSPESGKYQLYHERLRVYLLQKLKAKEAQVLNEKLISFLESAIKQAKGEEDEYYALAHLHQHMALESQLGNHYDRLHSYVNQESLWRRQIQLSKGYVWSQNAVQQSIKEGARRDHEMNTIRSTVNSVKLMIQEQNSAEDILNLLNEGDYQAALKRTETWEGERQFKLYLLFIHELTIGTSKEADFRKEGCKAVLEAINQTPEDHSELDWCTFYPELAVYKYHEELLKMELDRMAIWKRGTYTLQDLIGREDVNNDILKNLASQIPDVRTRSEAYREISKALINQGDMEESLKAASEITRGFTKSLAYCEISKVLFEQGEKEKSKEVINKSLKVASNLTDNTNTIFREISRVLMEQGNMEKSLKVASAIGHGYLKSLTYSKISKILMDQGKKEESHKVIKESLKVASDLTRDHSKSIAYSKISKILIEQGKKKKSLKVASQISDYGRKFSAYCEISNVLLEQGKKEESQQVMKESLKLASEIKNDLNKSEAYSEISKILMYQRNEKKSLKLASKITVDSIKVWTYKDISKILMEQEKKEESLKVASEITNEIDKSQAYIEISNVLMDQEKKEESKEAMKKSLKVASTVTDTRDKAKTYEAIFYSFNDKGLVREAIEVISKFMDTTKKSNAFLLISKRFYGEGDFQGALNIILKSLNTDTRINNSWKEYHSYMSISEALSRTNHDKLSVRITEEIWDVWDQSDALINVGKVLIEKGKTKAAKKIFKKSYSIASSITDPEYRNRAYLNLCSEFIQNDMFTHAYNLSLEIIANRGSTNLDLICKSFMDKGQKNKALKIASAINDKKTRVRVFSFFSIAMAKKGHKKDAEKFIKESIKVASEIIDDNARFKAYRPIINTLVKQAKIKKSLSLISEIKNDLIMSLAKKDLSTSLVKLGKTELALKFVEDIKDKYYKSRAYIDISKSLIEYGENLKVNEILVNLFRIAPNLGSRDQIEVYSDIFKIFIDLGDIKGALKIRTKIKNDRYQCNFYKKTSKVLLENGFFQNGIDFTTKIKNGRNAFLKSLGVIIDSTDLNLITSKINSEYDKNIIIDSVSKKIMEDYGSPDINQFTYNFHQNTQSLSNILYYQAKIACFFEEERNEEKLDMLSEVLDIKDWRRISASA